MYSFKSNFRKMVVEKGVESEKQQQKTHSILALIK